MQRLLVITLAALTCCQLCRGKVRVSTTSAPLCKVKQSQPLTTAGELARAAQSSSRKILDTCGTANWGQCGGLSCPGPWQCADAAVGCCPTGYSCSRQSAYYWQCLPSTTTTPTSSPAATSPPTASPTPSSTPSPTPAPTSAATTAATAVATCTCPEPVAFAVKRMSAADAPRDLPSFMRFRGRLA